MFMLCVYFVLQTLPPVVLRAKTVKAQIAEMDQLKHKMEIKEDSVKELKLQIMKKVRGQYVTCNDRSGVSLYYVVIGQGSFCIME